MAATRARATLGEVLTAVVTAAPPGVGPMVGALMVVAEKEVVHRAAAWEVGVLGVEQSAVEMVAALQAVASAVAVMGAVQ